ncbi:MAG: GMC family oxidoreductase [Nitrososphaerota archaeon]|nr:GMC family oxidoreductase [Nitrososphaerota archaeon]
MSTVIQEPAADVVLMGLGVMSGTIAAELSIAGYKVVGVTRGPYWDYVTDFSTTKYDEWGIGYGRKFDFPQRLQTTTIRNSSSQYALPTRRSTMPIQYHSLGFGVGGAAQHYGAHMERAGPWYYEVASSTASRYGSGFLESVNPNDDTEDWPFTYTEYEPYYVAWEQAFGLVGTNQGPLVPMSKNYPMPPHPSTAIASAFEAATEALGYHPYPHVNALASEPYVNTYGVQVNACVYDGWCGEACNYVCETGAKANSANRMIPAALKTGNFTMVLNSEIFRMDTNPDGTIADIRYYDSQGNIHVQPGTVFFNGLWGYNQTRSMLTSGVGVPYDPTTVTGTVGRGLTYGYGQYLSTPGPSGKMANIGANAYPAGNASGGGMEIYDFMDDNFDHTGLNFVGGTSFFMGTYAGGGPNNFEKLGGGYVGAVGAFQMGSAYKATWKDMYLPTSSFVGLGGVGPDLPTTTNYWDLDPNFVDAWGDPCIRITHDWVPNGYNTATYWAKGAANAELVAILQKMGATDISNGGTVVPPYSAHTDWWGHHWRGGNRIGKSSATSTFNGWQQCWTAPNLFAAGEVNDTLGDTVISGTHIAGPQVQVASEAIQMYLKSPGLLTGSLDGKTGPT